MMVMAMARAIARAVAVARARVRARARAVAVAVKVVVAVAVVVVVVGGRGCSRGSGGSFPPPFLFSRETLNSEERKKRRKRDGPRTDNTTISVGSLFSTLVKIAFFHNNVDVRP